MTSTSKQWADGPLALVQTPEATREVKNRATWIATQMAIAHNCFLRQINSVYQQSPYVTAKEDILDLLRYSKFAVHGIEKHHGYEEKTLFPIIEKITGQPGIMDVNAAEHEKFMPDFKKWGDYVEICLEDPAKFDSKKFRDHIDVFAKDFGGHLADEIETLVALEKYDQEALYKAWVKFEADIIDTVDKSVDFPLMMSAHDATYEGGIHHWPPGLPFFVPYLIQYWFMRKHQGVWRFAPADVWGQPRPLEFIP